MEMNNRKNTRGRRTQYIKGSIQVSDMYMRLPIGTPYIVKHFNKAFKRVKRTIRHSK